MINRDFLLGFGAGKAAGGGGGGGDIAVESLSVSTNGTYTAPTGKAYSPVSVDVQPDLQSKSVTITENGTTNITPDTGKDGLSSVAVSVSVSGGGGGLEYEEGSFTVDSAVGSHSVTFSNQHSTPPAMITLADATGDLNAKNAPCIWSVINAKDIFGSKLEVNTNTFIGYFQVCYSRTQSAVSPKTTFGSDDPPPFFSSSGFTFDIYSLDAKYFRADRTYKWIAVWMS